MESKKLPFSEQLQWPRRKVVSGFSLGVATSLIVLTVLLLSNNSLKGGFLFQGLNNVGVNSSISWPFHFSISNSSGKNSDLMHRIEEEKDKNGNFSVEDGRFEEKSNEGNGSVVTKNGNLLGSNEEEETILENTHLGNFSENIKNGSYLSEEGRDSGNGNFSISAKNDVNEEKKIVEGKSVEDSRSGNFSNNGENGRFFPGDGKDSSEKNKIEISNYDSNYEKCDIYDGKWVRDDSKPYYPAGSCSYIGRDFDCHLNGRPDDGFLKWKWQPNGCNIPSMNATDFLERLRGQKMVFVGDSLNRNMWESLVCILRHSVTNKKSVYEISGRTEFKKNGFYAFRFEDYNCTVDFVSSPFLVRESSFKGRNGSFETLRLDLMDGTTSMYHDADIIIFNTGHWWTHEKTSRGEDYYQEGNYVHPKLKVLEAYKKALTTWARWVDKNIDSKRTQVFFRGYSVTHFRGGQWNSGGQCHKETEPIFNKTYLAKYPSKMRALEPVLQKLKTPVIYLNISRLTDFRKDGHPSIYRMKYKTAAERIAAERSQDCSHWCLPGVPDTWNELLYASLLKAGRGSWRK